MASGRGAASSETIQIKNRDEIGQLASSFNRMIQALRKSREELEEWGKTLEKKVESRTKDLKDACQKLEMTQAQLVQSSKLASIGELAAGMAHEINNPMNVIIGYAELLLDEIEPDTESYAYAQGIRGGRSKNQQHYQKSPDLCPAGQARVQQCLYPCSD